MASGDYDMGFADINALIKYRDANPKDAVKAVFMVYNRPAYAVIGRKSRGINAPKDLEGKKLGAPAGGIAFAQWPIFVKANGIDAAKVTIENVGMPVRDPMLAAGQVDAITGLSFVLLYRPEGQGRAGRRRGGDADGRLRRQALRQRRHREPEIRRRAHPEAVKGFLRAFLKGLKKTVAAPAAAIGFVLERADGASKNLELDRLKMVIRDNILTPEVKADGYGGIDAARFAAAIDQLAIAYKFKSAKPKPDDIFDASYLPPADAAAGRIKQDLRLIPDAGEIERRGR